MLASLRTAKCSIVLQRAVFLETQVYAQHLIAVYTRKTKAKSASEQSSLSGEWAVLLAISPLYRSPEELEGNSLNKESDSQTYSALANGDVREMAPQ